MKIHLNQALRIEPIQSNGYFEEPLGSAKLIDHYHRFIFKVNVSSLENSYNIVVNNSYSILSKLDEFKLDDISYKLLRELQDTIDQIKEVLDKLGYNNRTKRGLINVLGTAIKFITGNLDDNDMQTIQNNIDKLKANKNQEIEKINQLTSLANHITDRLIKQTDTINQNFVKSEKAIQRLTKITDLRTVIQEEIYNAKMLTAFLGTIERTFSMSLNEIPNLEILSKNELSEIRNYLNKVYHPDQLVHFDSLHLFQILESAKLNVIGTKQTMSFLLKISILKPFQANYSKIYPLPDDQDIIIIPPKKYLIRVNQRQFWTDEECKPINSGIICHQQPIEDKCSTLTLEHCFTAKVTNDFEITQVLSNGQLLVTTKQNINVLEDCLGLVSTYSVKNSNLLSSKCRITIGSLVFDQTLPIFELNTPNISRRTLNYQHEVPLYLRHLDSPRDLRKEAADIQTIRNRNIEQTTHYSITGIFVLITISLIIVFICYKKKISELLCQPRTIIHLQPGTNSLESTQGLDEDVQS